jgi:hypothetical protein
MFVRQLLGVSVEDVREQLIAHLRFALGLQDFYIPFEKMT